MKFQKMFLFVVLLVVFTGFVNANSDRVNNLILGKTLSNVIYEVSEDIIENRSEIITINVLDSNHPFVVNFISGDYATTNNITCDDGNCTLFGRYEGGVIYILPETINNYYNFSELNQTLEKISNTFIHELSHHYQYQINEFMPNLVESLGMDVTYQGGTSYTLHNYNDYWNLNVSDVPESISGTINFPNALSTYTSGDYVKEIQVRLVAVCFQEKEDYNYYWDMIKIKDYQVCEQYEFPTYVDNRLASDFGDFIEAYVVDYLGVEIYAIDPEVSETIDSSFSVVNTVVSGVSDVIIWLIPIFILGGLISFIGFILFIFRDSLDKIFDSILKKK